MLAVLTGSCELNALHGHLRLTHVWWDNHILGACEVYRGSATGNNRKHGDLNLCVPRYVGWPRR